MSIWPFRPNRGKAQAERVLKAMVAASRQPQFYGPNRVPDTLEGRFELLTLHAGLAFKRFHDAPEAKALAQGFTDALFRHIDSGLREAGVGDLTVPKRMRRLAGDFYGRVEAYAGALAAADRAALGDAIARNILGDAADPAFTAKLAGYAADLAERQARAPASALAEPGAWEGAKA